jgi:PAS domain S-box-containing protein
MRLLNPSERKRAEAQMRRLATVVTDSNDAITIQDLDGTITGWNRGAERMYGYSEEEALGMNIVEIVPEEKRAEANGFIAGIRSGNLVESLETQRLIKDGRVLDVWLTISPLRDEVGNIFAIATTERDITARKRAEDALKQYSERLEEMVEERTKELREAQEALVRKEKLAILGQLAGGVGHELRNPLGVISNAVYYLKTILPDANETTKEYLAIISSEVRNSEKIVSDLLDLSRTKPGEREEVAVSELVAQALNRQSPPEQAKVTTEIAPDLPPLFVDPRQIGQVLVNLITNAYDAMPEGGRLTVKAKHEKDMVYLSISDTGCGISKENMERLFEPLFTTKARGIGLGLAVSKNLAEANGGSVEAESEEGKGSTFTVILPTKEAQA